MWKEYVDMTRSPIADYRNYSYDIQAGTIMAGAFLSNFVPKDTAWIHLDIAGVDSLRYPSQTRYSGATGEILQSVFDFIQMRERPIYENSIKRITKETKIRKRVKKNKISNHIV
jgi:leucyl aminopeptidase